MLTLALAATLGGFVLLVLGLITGQVWLAVACIVICLVGLVFLLVDVIGSGRRKNARSIEDMVPNAGDDGVADTGTAEYGAAGDGAAETATGEAVDRAPDGVPAHTGRHAAPVPALSGTESSPEAPRPQQAVEPEPTADQRRDGGLEDYLRSVGGTDFPGRTEPGASQTPRSGASTPPSPATPWPQGPAPQGPAPRHTAAPVPQQAPAAPPEPKIDPLDPNWRPPLD